MPNGYAATVADIDQPVLAALDDAWKAIQERDDRVKDVRFDLNPTKATSEVDVEWDRPVPPTITLNLVDRYDAAGRHPLGDEYRLSGHEVMHFLTRLAAQSIHPRPPGVDARKLPREEQALLTTSSGSEGWHKPVGFKTAAEGLGLVVERGKHGWNKTSLPPGEYRTQTQQLDQAIQAWTPDLVRKSQRGPYTIQCKCGKGRYRRFKVKTLRGSSGPLAALGITLIPGDASTSRLICPDCGQPFAFSPAPPGGRRATSRPAD